MLDDHTDVTLDQAIRTFRGYVSKLQVDLNYNAMILEALLVLKADRDGSSVVVEEEEVSGE